MCHCHLSPDCLAICSGTKASSGTEASDHETAEGIQELDLRVWVLTYTCPRRYHMRQQVPHFVNCDIQIENKKICSKIIAGRPYNCRTLQCKLEYSRLRSLTKYLLFQGHQDQPGPDGPNMIPLRYLSPTQRNFLSKTFFFIPYTPASIKRSHSRNLPGFPSFLSLLYTSVMVSRHPSHLTHTHPSTS